MLARMIIQGLVAAALVGAAATVYAQVKEGTGDLSSDPAPAEAPATARPTTPPGDGYLRPSRERSQDDDDDNDDRHKRGGARRDHDDD